MPHTVGVGRPGNAAAARLLMLRGLLVAGPAVLAGALHRERVLGQKLVGDRTERHIA